MLSGYNMYNDAISTVKSEAYTINEKNIESWNIVKHIIKRVPALAVEYALSVIKHRWLEAEPYILTDRNTIYTYVDRVIKCRWPEGEKALLELSQPSYNGQYILYSYANTVIRGRWLEAEPLILTDYEAIYYYAEYLIDGRWPEGEEAFLKMYRCSYVQLYYMYTYALSTVKGRWFDAESMLKQDDYIWDMYSSRFKI